MKRLLLAPLLCLLAGCAAPIQSAEPTIYRTTQGGKPVAWNLSIWPPNKTGPARTATHLDPQGIEGGFKWQLSEEGNTVQLLLSARNDTLSLPPRAVVSLTVDGQPAFYGVVPDPPSVASPESEGVQVAGGQEALRVTLMDGKAYKDMGVYAIARDILSRLCPPALIYSPTLIGDGTGTDAGPSLGTYYAPTSTLQDVLEGLAKSAGKPWGVDAQGRIFFGRPQPAALTVAYAGQPWRRLPVQGREAVTQAVLRVATTPSEGATGQTQLVPNEYVDYLPATQTSVATSALHPLYGAAKAFSVPEGVSLTKDSRVGTLSATQMADPGNATDSNAETGSSSTGADPFLQLAAPAGQRVIGVRLRYTLSQDAGEAYLNLLHQTDNGFILPIDKISLNLPASSEAREVFLIGPPSTYLNALGNLKTTAQVQAFSPAGSVGVLTVFDFAVLVVDEVQASTLASTFLQDPYAAPAEITLDYLAPPSPLVTVTGSPDGTVSGPAGLFEYEHSAQNVRTTRVRVGSTGSSPVVRALRWSMGQQ